MSELKSQVWNYFKILENDHKKTSCKLCKKELKYIKGSTSTMSYHLLKVHNITTQQNFSETPTSSKMRKIETYFEAPDTIESIVAKLACVDGFSIHGITNSVFIRSSFSQKGLTLPKSESTVMDLIVKDFFNKKDIMKKILQEEMLNNEKFSLTMDEWTSVRGRRYFNLNLHQASGQFYNLGLIRIHGSCNSIQMHNIIESHLQDFGITFNKDIVACTADGAAVNVKFGGESPTELQQCLAHGIHLAVMDVLCSKKKTYESESDDDEDEDGFEYELFDTSYTKLKLDENINNCLEAVRKIVRFFKNSSVKNNILQLNVKQAHKKELELLIDAKTRWNSIVPMLERFIMLKDCIRDSLEELSSLNMFYNVDFEFLSTLADALLPIKLTVEALCKSDANIIQAEGALSFLYTKLEKLNSEISNKFLLAVKARMHQRQNKNLIDLAKYILNPNIPINKDLIKYATDLLQRLYCLEDSSENEVSDDEDIILEETLENTMADELRSAIEKALAEPNPKENFEMLRQEFNLYRKTNNKTKNISLLFKAIQTVKPSSTECERAFSIAGKFCTKVRSRLSDQSLNALVFLKFYYLKNK